MQTIGKTLIRNYREVIFSKSHIGIHSSYLYFRYKFNINLSEFKFYLNSECFKQIFYTIFEGRQMNF